MKYNLINIATQEETICAKITLEDGFDYYVSDEIIKDVRPHKGKWHIEKDYILNKFPTYLADLSECKLVIASNNPNIDLPKVFDEVEVLVEIEGFASKERDGSYLKNGYNKAKETYQFNEQDMIDFGKFAKSYKSSKNVENALITWKSQKPTTIYYQTTP